jgi:hypothetical protein
MAAGVPPSAAGVKKARGSGSTRLQIDFVLRDGHGAAAMR